MKLIIDRLHQVEARDERYFISEKDICLYILRHYFEKRYDYNKFNQLIANYKRDAKFKKLKNNNFVPNFKYTFKTKWDYKEEAINFFGEVIGKFFCGLDAIFVPIPPSKSKDSDHYDDRNVRCLKKANEQYGVRYYDILDIKTSIVPYHKSDVRRDPREILKNAKPINKDLVDLNHKCVFLFDDLLTSGSHFKAYKQLVQQAYPNAAIYGFFLGLNTKSNSSHLNPIQP